ncbi:MAG: hypothetical protein DBX47_01520 [Clostridiales bacterium]|nr:MAG: hypothetical protein DBX47_01520 [Clostridiales bacterium]
MFFSLFYIQDVLRASTPHLPYLENQKQLLPIELTFSNKFLLLDKQAEIYKKTETIVVNNSFFIIKNPVILFYQI